MCSVAACCSKLHLKHGRAWCFQMAHFLMTYLAGLLSIYCRNWQRPRVTTKCSSTVTWGLGFLHVPYSSKFVTFLLALPWFPVIQEYDRSWETWWMEILAFQSHFSKGLLLLLLTCKLLPKWASQCRLSSQLNPRLSNCPNTHTSPQNLSLEVQYFQSMVSCRAYMMTWYPQNDWIRIWWGHEPGLTLCYWLSIALSQPCGWSWERVHIIFPFLGGIVPAGGWETTGVSTLSSSSDENCSKSGSSSTQSSVSDTFSSMSLSKGCAKTSVTVKLFPEGICFREQCTKSKDLEACHGSFYKFASPLMCVSSQCPCGKVPATNTWEISVLIEQVRV